MRTIDLLASLLLAAPLVAAPAAAKGKAEPTSKTEKFGQPVSAGKPIALAAVLEKPDQYAGRSVLVDGKVRAACTRKGCWMELAPSADKSAQGCRVRFKDYGFFVPTNSAGAEARVEGIVAVRTVPPAEVQHYESEGGSFPNKAKDGSAVEISMTATGVELRR